MILTPALGPFQAVLGLPEEIQIIVLN